MLFGTEARGGNTALPDQVGSLVWSSRRMTNRRDYLVVFSLHDLDSGLNRRGHLPPNLKTTWYA